MQLINEDFKQRRLKAISEDRRSTASSLIRKAFEDLMDYTDHCKVDDSPALVQELAQLAQAMIAARPAQTGLNSLLGRWCEEIQSLAGEALPYARRRSASLADQLIESMQLDQAAQIEHCCKQLSAGMCLMTLGLSSSVLGVFNACYEQGKSLTAIVSESRPGMEGRKLARYLNQRDIKTLFITEAQISHFIRQADLVLIGSSSLHPDGSCFSKIGSLGMALAAKDQGKPFWVLGETYKQSELPAAQLVAEHLPEEDLYVDHLASVEVRNLAQDLIPARLITAWIDERDYYTGFVPYV